MLSVEETKQLIGRPDMSDEEAQLFRDQCYELMSIIFDSWYYDQSSEDDELPDIEA